MIQQMRIGLLLDLNLILVIVFLIFFLNVRKENNFQRLGEDRKTKRERETLKVRKGQRGRRIRRRRKGSRENKDFKKPFSFVVGVFFSRRRSHVFHVSLLL